MDVSLSHLVDNLSSKGIRNNLHEGFAREYNEDFVVACRGEDERDNGYYCCQSGVITEKS